MWILDEIEGPRKEVSMQYFWLFLLAICIVLIVRNERVYEWRGAQIRLISKTTKALIEYYYNGDWSTPNGWEEHQARFEEILDAFYNVHEARSYVGTLLDIGCWDGAKYLEATYIGNLDGAAREEIAQMKR